MSFKKFVDGSGFKVLAMARLNPCEYSVTLYLINCAVSGLSDVVSTENEIASLIGYDEPTIRQALDSLSQRRIIRLRYGQPHVNPDIDSMRIGMQFDTSKWILDFEPDVTSEDAIVFPFRRAGQTNLQLCNNDKNNNHKGKPIPTWQRVLDSFLQGRNLDNEEMTRAEDIAKILVETHHVDQVLLMIRHFGGRIPTLSLLASSWQHYLEVFDEETHKVDLLDARQKHLEFDEKLREQSRLALEKATDLNLTDEERDVLHILISHRHPRRQLFWAYQSRSRYPHLSSFFADNAALMIAVTSGGKVLYRPNMMEDDDE